MKLELLPEPEVEFAAGFREIDPRFGIIHHGPVDRGTERGLTELRVGVVGTAETVEKLLRWMERCSAGVDAKPSKQPRLFPRFAGFGGESSFGARLVLDPRLQRTISVRAIAPIVARAHEASATEDAVKMFLDLLNAIAEEGPPPHVVLCAPPQELLEALEASSATKAAEEDELDETIEANKAHEKRPAFHDVLKARALNLPFPLQMVRETTYDPAGVKKRKRERTDSDRPKRQLQDEATRAWNFFTALYHKGGGTLWRLARAPTDLATCYLGVSFYFTHDASRMMASVAQVFNERGDGMIVRGGPALRHKDDRQVHLAEEDARELVKSALETFRKEHKTLPARMVVHKTSPFNDAEFAGMSEAAEEARVEMVDLISLRRSLLRLYRTQTYPPLRGTWLRLTERRGILYLRGSVPFFETYPGLYVPRPLEYSCARLDSDNSRAVAEEMLALSKLNWNNTQFDGGEPITVRAARRVGDIMKNIPEGGPDRLRFRFFM